MPVCDRSIHTSRTCACQQASRSYCYCMGGQQSTPVGFEPTGGDPIGLAGRRLNHSAKVSLDAWIFSCWHDASLLHAPLLVCTSNCVVSAPHLPRQLTGHSDASVTARSRLVSAWRSTLGGCCGQAQHGNSCNLFCESSVAVEIISACGLRRRRSENRVPGARQ